MCQVLLNAFGRALKDTFPPARCAALRAMAATTKYYSADEVACRALPAVCPLCVDPLPGTTTPLVTGLACRVLYDVLFGRILKGPGVNRVGNVK